MKSGHEPGCLLNDPDGHWEDTCTCGGKPLKCWDCGKAADVIAHLDDEIELADSRLKEARETIDDLRGEITRLRRWVEVMQPVCDAVVDMTRAAQKYESTPEIEDQEEG